MPKTLEENLKLFRPITIDEAKLLRNGETVWFRAIAGNACKAWASRLPEGNEERPSHLAVTVVGPGPWREVRGTFDEKSICAGMLLVKK